jgi:glucose-6-phosphate isomerase
VRCGELKGYTGKPLKSFVCIGIGGSYLGPEFVYEALRHDKTAKSASTGFSLNFLANVDPIDFARAMEGVDIEETLFIVISKTLTTAETMLNARSAKRFLLDYYKQAYPDVAEKEFVSRHVCAVSTNLEGTSQFGIAPENVFGFWDWVGGRFSVSSAVGLLPLSLFYGYSVMSSFLEGMHDVDCEIYDSDSESRWPMMLGLTGWYNTYICGHNSRAILPYCQALHRFPAHIQ